jgi:hypothetical protein
LYKQESDTTQTLLTDEGRILDLISTGAPLAHMLDKICTALDLQVGNIVSLVLLPDDEEHTRQEIAQNAEHFGLFVFCCAAILSPSEELLGTFEVYCCFPRSPSASESRLIERAAQLAALAIQGHNHEQDSERFSFHWKGAMGRSHHEGPPSKN